MTDAPRPFDPAGCGDGRPGHGRTTETSAITEDHERARAFGALRCASACTGCSTPPQLRRSVHRRSSLVPPRAGRPGVAAARAHGAIARIRGAARNGWSRRQDRGRGRALPRRARRPRQPQPVAAAAPMADAASPAAWRSSWKAFAWIAPPPHSLLRDPAGERVAGLPTSPPPHTGRGRIVIRRHPLVHACGKRPRRASRRRPHDRRGRALPGHRSDGIGKSTLLGTINGLVPISPADISWSRDHRRRARHPTAQAPSMAETVGYVGQDPLAGFVTDTVEEELAYAMEQLGLPPT